MVNTWSSLYQNSKQNFSDFILTYEKSYCDKIAQTLLFIWPFLFILLDDAAKINEPQETGTAKVDQAENPETNDSARNFESDEEMARRLQYEEN